MQELAKEKRQNIWRGSDQTGDRKWDAARFEHWKVIVKDRSDLEEVSEKCGVWSEVNMSSLKKNNIASMTLGIMVAMVAEAQSKPIWVKGAITTQINGQTTRYHPYLW